ncbi:hypothetical protein RFN28_28010 [Mesorhizobium sp. VK24D]|uniref:FAD dependent oxidoreductase n=1 Tax=Mesorhizobium album TaxID=3072314 RepID=A0ABU4Y7H7_9HYPH|nr:hypothetical protein [Mesorhizobium sp. VK24D]MDX8482273.1 hypothetical protein [Mesorhizobium sp. VK24D]
MTRRSDYLEVGGMDEVRFPINFHDVDYCLKLRALGRRIVFTPHAKLVHDEPARSEIQAPLFEREVQNLRTKWGSVLAADPYYSPMLSLDPRPFSALGWPPRAMGPRESLFGIESPGLTASLAIAECVVEHLTRSAGAQAQKP